MRIRATAALLAAVLAFMPGTATAQESGAPPVSSQTSSVGLSKLETADLTLLYYDPIQTYLTPYLARAHENSAVFHRRMFDWKPWDRTYIYLRDLRDTGQAIVPWASHDTITLDIAPFPVTFETFSPGERFFTLMNHEIAHVATADVWNDDDAFWRRFFHGKVAPTNEHPESVLYAYLTTPRTIAPRWFFEGSAVFFETWMGGGLGRAQGAYDEMVFRAMVRDNATFHNPLSLEASGIFSDFQANANNYLYGTRFFSYLTLIYGPEKVLAWLRRGPESKGYYASQFQQVFGKTIEEVWTDWAKYEHEFQQKNLASVQQYPATPVRRLTTHTLGSVSRSFYDPETNTVIGGFRYVGQIAHIGALSLATGEVRKLVNIKGPALFRVTSVAYDPAAHILYYTEDNNAFRDLMQLDVRSGESKTLIVDGRTGDLALNPVDRSLWGIRHINGLDTLVRTDPDHTAWALIHTFDYGHTLFDLDISPDGQLLSASVGEINGDQRIDVYRIADVFAGNFTPVATMTRGPAIPEGGTFSPDGRYLYATAYYTGVSNVYRMEIATGKIEAVSNAVTGFFRPMPLADGSLIVYEYTGQGFSPVRIDPKPLEDLGTIKFFGTEVANAHPVIKTWGVGSPAAVPLDSMITGRGPYEPMREMRLSSAYPMIMGYKAHPALGGYVLFEDPMQYDQLAINLSYSPLMGKPAKEDLHADISFHTLYWKAGYWHNLASFYDLFGPVDRSRKGDSVYVGYTDVLIYDPPRQLTFTADLQGYVGLDTLPGAQNVHANVHNLITGKLGLVYTNLEQSLGAVDYEEGQRANINLQTDYALGEAFPKLRAGFDFGFALPWNNSSFWLYNAAGAAGGSSNNVLGYYYFGAFGNNFVDDKEVKRYREYDSFPGFSIDAISARSFAKTVAEINLPPIRFSDIGTPAFYLSSARPAVFAGVMAADDGHNGFTRTYETAGFQIDWNFTVAVRLPMTLSIGYAHGFGNAPGRADEIMLSLKII